MAERRTSATPGEEPDTIQPYASTNLLKPLVWLSF